MPGFRWEVNHDIALALEVVSKRPQKPADWINLAEALSKSFSTENPVQLKGRGCKERLDLLLKKYKDDDKKALKRSGTEEDFTELNQLLEDISVFTRDFTLEQVKKKCETKKKDDDRRKGEEMRQAAMMSRNPSPTTSSIDLDEDDVEYNSHINGPSKKKMKFTKGKEVKRRVTTAELLQEKYERNAVIKEKELELRKMELELQQRKWAVEEEERKKRLELDAEKMKLEAEERKAIIELLKKFAK